MLPNGCRGNRSVGLILLEGDVGNPMGIWGGLGQVAVSTPELYFLGEFNSCQKKKGKRSREGGLVKAHS